MRGKIFINYRRGDDPGSAQALYARLEQAFSADRLFMDVDNIPPGHDFVHVLEAQIQQCDVLLAVIGPRWLGATDEKGFRRLDDPNDFVRIELESALKHGKHVIPVLVSEAQMPRADELPDPLKPLVRRNAVRLTHERLRADTQGLVRALEQSLGEAEAARRPETKIENQRSTHRGEAIAPTEPVDAERHRAIHAENAISTASRRARVDEGANWEFIKDSQDAQNFRDHIARFPGGRFENEARARLETLIWSETETKSGAAPLKSFLEEFGDGTHAAQAQSRLAALDRAIRAQETIKSPLDFGGGLFLLGLAVVGYAGAFTLPFGQLSGIGSGLLPKVVAVLVAAFGIMLVVQSLLTEGDRLEQWAVRGLIFVLGGVLIFAVTIRSWGLLVAGPFAVVVSSLADSRARPLEVFAMSVVLVLALIVPPQILVSPWPLAVILCAFVYRNTRPLEVAALAVGLTLVCGLMFKELLNLPIPFDPVGIIPDPVFRAYVGVKATIAEAFAALKAMFTR